MDREKKEAMMKRGFHGLVLIAAFLLAAGTVWGQSIDEKIKSLEQELNLLKEQQIEMKKEATTAAATMPTFTFRPGSGVMIEAADKSWALRNTLETHFRYNFETGRASVGRSQGELMGRRFRPGVFFCVNNCLWEAEATLDLDGWGTGNGKNNTSTLPASMLQRGAIRFAADQLNPWLPRVEFGMEVSGASGGSLARQGSGNVGAQAEYDLHTRNDGFNTGRAGSGIILNWDDRSLSDIGIPGRIGRFQLGMANFAEGDDNTQGNTDRQDFNVYLSLMPFSQVKNKWISGLTFEYGAWFCNVDVRAAQNGCSRYRIQDHGDGGRQTLFDTGATGGNNPTGSIGKGLHVGQGPGVVWSVGPYTFRTMGFFQRSEDDGGLPGKKRGNSFLLGHDLYVWSPKGWLTGGPNDVGSVLTGTHFERVDMSCGDRQRTCGAAGNLGQFRRERVLLREWDLWYVVGPRMNVGINILWYDASNLNNAVNQAGQNLGFCSRNATGTATNCRRGVGGDWVDWMLNYRWQF
jgi:hypothetical protein